jgi:hypothetical protein
MDIKAYLADSKNSRYIAETQDPQDDVFNEELELSGCHHANN